MNKLWIMSICIVMLSVSACSTEEPENYGAIPKETLDKVTEDAQAATKEAKEKIDAALKNIE